MAGGYVGNQLPNMGVSAAKTQNPIWKYKRYSIIEKWAMGKECPWIGVEYSGDVDLSVFQYGIYSVDTADWIKDISKMRIMSNGRPRKDFMYLLDTIHGTSKRPSNFSIMLTYLAPHRIGRKPMKRYLTHAGFVILDAIAKNNKKFAKFLNAYDSKAARDRSAEVSTTLLLGMVPHQFEPDLLHNFEVKKKQELEQLALLQAKMNMQQAQLNVQMAAANIWTPNTYTSTTSTLGSMKPLSNTVTTTSAGPFGTLPGAGPFRSKK